MVLIINTQGKYAHFTEESNKSKDVVMREIPHVPQVICKQKLYAFLEFPLQSDPSGSKGVDEPVLLL